VQTHATSGRLYDVEYRLTALGQTLIPVLAAVRDWAEHHVAGVLAAQAEHDKNRQPSSSGSQ
jgi:DNA-binding HxlR family transcriptional regulator